MNNPFKTYKPAKPKGNSERAHLVGIITDKINLEREGTKYSKVTPRLIGVRVAHLRGNQDLYFLISKCSKAKSFGACFFGELKVSKPGNKAGAAAK